MARRRGNRTLEPGDALILLSVVMGGKKPADLSSIIGAADYLDHAIPTRDELSGSLTRLGAAGLVRKRKAGFCATDRALELYQKTKDNCTTAWRTRLRGLDALAACPCCGVRFGKPRREVVIEEATYADAVAAYRKRFDNA